MCIRDRVKIDSFAYMPVQEFGNAFSTFIAQNYGAKKHDRITKGIRSAVCTSFVFSAAVSLAVCIFARPLMQIFVRPEETEIIAVEMCIRDRCFDAGHANCFSEAPICDWTENLGNYITHLHLHDNSGSRDSHLGLGCGNVPVDRIFYSLRGRAFTCAIECGTREGVMQSYRRLLQLGYKE